jgi:hypothetical protein
MKTALSLVGVLVVLLVAGCKQQADIQITGTIAGLQPADSVFVTLSKSWEKGVVAPTLFNLDTEGRFDLRFAFAGNPPPVTFVKNGKLLAQMSVKKAWKYDPYIVDQVSRRQFPVDIVSEGVLKVQIQIGQ